MGSSVNFDVHLLCLDPDSISCGLMYGWVGNPCWPQRALAGARPGVLRARTPLRRGTALAGSPSHTGAVSRFFKSLVWFFHCLHQIILLILLKSSLGYIGIILMSTIKEPERPKLFFKVCLPWSPWIFRSEVLRARKSELNSCISCNCLFRQASYACIYSLNKKGSYLEMVFF